MDSPYPQQRVRQLIKHAGKIPSPLNNISLFDEDELQPLSQPEFEQMVNILSTELSLAPSTIRQVVRDLRHGSNKTITSIARSTLELRITKDDKGNVELGIAVMSYDQLSKPRTVK